MQTAEQTRQQAASETVGHLINGEVVTAGVTTQPVYNPVSQLVYAAARSQVTHAWIAGEPVLEDGELTKLDFRATLEEAEHWRVEILAHDPH